jgi:predicted deacylase
MLSSFIRKAESGCFYTRVPVTSTCTGAIVEIPVILLQGMDGPGLYVGAAIHGNELNGIDVIFRLLNSIEPSNLRGKLILTPVQNPIAFQHKQGFTPGDVYDVPQENLYAAFPGSSTGELNERIADAILKIVKHADYAIDLHTGKAGYYYLDHSFSFFSRNECSDKARELAKIFGTPIVTDMESGHWVTDNMFHEVANKLGIPAFGVELGQAGLIEPNSVEAGYRGVLNILKYLGMLDGEVRKNANQRVIDKIVPVRASTGGILKHCVEIGAWVESGQELARIYDLYLREVEIIKSPVAAIVYVQKTYPIVNGGERVSVVGVPKNSGEFRVLEK